ncbi:hypothetical protein CC80DRAFT_320447 [Byssothecium circinans]|uniref:Uncharacterized protein n=1 Tax=Byssothecium circinans TaxID=147558 RepID=A0A6A5U440_9PLEO|nr:hypothetical protein CC80DRAFT_320447 [Byssothecium circinans]
MHDRRQPHLRPGCGQLGGAEMTAARGWRWHCDWMLRGGLAEISESTSVGGLHFQRSRRQLLRFALPAHFPTHRRPPWNPDSSLARPSSSTCRALDRGEPPEDPCGAAPHWRDSRRRQRSSSRTSAQAHTASTPLYPPTDRCPAACHCTPYETGRQH